MSYSGISVFVDTVKGRPKPLPICFKLDREARLKRQKRIEIAGRR